jgi:membrane protease YdiL (CAAX protease family)
MASRRPLTTFVLLAYGIGWPALMIPVVTDLPEEPFLLVLLFLALLGPALLVTRWADGPGAVRRLLARTLIWRFGLGRWTVVLLAMPLLTLGLAAASGTLATPARGWAGEAGLYLFSTLVFGALVANLWEETAWGGFVQTRLMARHGLLVGSLLTAPLFALIHVPLQLGGGASWTESAFGILVVFAGAPFYRYLLGIHLMDTGGSILAIAVQHAAWNASGKPRCRRGRVAGGGRGGAAHVAGRRLATVAAAGGRAPWSRRGEGGGGGVAERRAEAQIQRSNQIRSSHSEWVRRPSVQIGQNHAKLSSTRTKKDPVTITPAVRRRVGANDGPISVPIVRVSASTRNGRISTA